MSKKKFKLPKEKIFNYILYPEIIQDQLKNINKAGQVYQYQLSNNRAKPLTLDKTITDNKTVFVYDDSYRQTQRWFYMDTEYTSASNPDIYRPEEIHIVRAAVKFDLNHIQTLTLLCKVYFEIYFKDRIWKGAYIELSKIFNTLEFKGEFSTCIQAVYTKERIQGTSKKQFLRYAHKRFKEYKYHPEDTHKSEDQQNVRNFSIINLFKFYNLINDQFGEQKFNFLFLRILIGYSFFGRIENNKKLEDLEDKIKLAEKKDLDKDTEEINYRKRSKIIDLEVKIKINIRIVLTLQEDIEQKDLQLMKIYMENESYRDAFQRYVDKRREFVELIQSLSEHEKQIINELENKYNIVARVVLHQIKETRRNEQFSSINDTNVENRKIEFVDEVLERRNLLQWLVHSDKIESNEEFNKLSDEEKSFFMETLGDIHKNINLFKDEENIDKFTIFKLEEYERKTIELYENFNIHPMRELENKDIRMVIDEEFLDSFIEHYSEMLEESERKIEILKADLRSKKFETQLVDVRIMEYNRGADDLEKAINYIYSKRNKGK